MAIIASRASHAQTNPTTYKLVDLSRNPKTGVMPAVYGHKDSCPPTCALMDSCYGKQGRAALHWATDAGASFADLIDWVSRLPRRTMWRFGVVGDLPGNGADLCKDSILALARANKKRPALAYSHYPATASNLETLRAAKRAGFTINASCDSLADVRAAVAAGVPAVTYTDAGDTRKSWRQDGIRFVTCPNQSLKAEPQCKDCQLCADGDRGYVVVFRAHASKKNSIAGVV